MTLLKDLKIIHKILNYSRNYLKIMPRGIAKGKKRLTEEERKAKDKARRQTPA